MNYAPQPQQRPPKMKKRYNPFMFIGEAFKNIWRDKGMSTASILVLASCLVLLGCFALLVYNINFNMAKLTSLNEIVVFVDYDLSDEEILSVEEQIKALDNIKSVEHITKEQGLEDLKNSYEGYENLFNDIEQKGDNPLADSFKIQYIDNSKVTSLVYLINEIPGVMKINNRLDLATSLENFKDGITMIFVWFLVILFIVSVFIIINTIKLAVNSHMEEIRVMKYIGASDWFIVVPYILEGTIIGLIASCISYAIEWYLYYSMNKTMLSDVKMIELVPFGEIGGVVAIAFVGVGVLTGIIGSCISLRKNLQA